jgi:indole-3-glycerol phosphate synthase
VLLRSLLATTRTLGLAALVEVHDLDEAERAAASGAEIIGVNSRNLRTLSVDPAVHEAVAHALPASVVKVAESGIRTHGDIERLSAAGYDAFLVGERLISRPDPGVALRELRGL